MKQIKKLSTIAAATGLGALLLTGITGCGESTQAPQEQEQAKGAFLIIEEISEETRIVLKKLDGTEKVLTKEEMDALVKEEAAKIDEGTSNLTKEQPAEANAGGMGLGETIMASMAGAMLGAWIGNKLFGNQNYQNNRKASYKSPSTYSRSKSSFNKSRSSKTSSTKKSGFFGSKKRSSSSHRSSFGG